MKKYRSIVENEEAEVLINSNEIHVGDLKIKIIEENGILYILSENEKVEVDDVVELSDGKYVVHVKGFTFDVEIHDPIKDLVGSSSTVSGEIKSPMAGVITSINVEMDQVVKEGDLLLILSAMKMENEILSPVSGTVISIEKAVNSQVSPEELLLVIKED